MLCKDCNQEFSKLYAPSKQQCQRCYKREWERNANKDPVLHAKIRARAKRTHENNKAKHLADMKEFREKTQFSGNRQTVLERDKHTCNRCGIVLPESKLVVHHEDRQGRGSEVKNNDVNNLVTTCRACHCKEHQAELIKARRAKMDKDIV